MSSPRLLVGYGNNNLHESCENHSRFYSSRVYLYPTAETFSSEKFRARKKLVKQQKENF